MPQINWFDSKLKTEPDPLLSKQVTIVHKKQKKRFYKREKKNTISVKTFLKEKKNSAK